MEKLALIQGRLQFVNSIQGDSCDDGFRTTLLELLVDCFGDRLVYIYSTTESRVSLGYYDGRNGRKCIMDGELSANTLLELRLFDESQEIRLFRRCGELCGRILSENDSLHLTSSAWKLEKNESLTVYKKTEINYMNDMVVRVGDHQVSGRMRYAVVYYFEEDSEKGILQCLDERLAKIYELDHDTNQYTELRI